MKANVKEIKKIIEDAVMATIINNEPENVDLSYKAPQVMGADGKMTDADAVRASVKINDIAMDSINPAGGGAFFGAGFNQAYFNQLNNLLIDNVFLGYSEYSILLQNGLLYSMCDIPATDMTRNWIELRSTGDKDKADRIRELEYEFERLNVKELFQRASFFAHAQGGAMLYPKLKGDDLNQELKQELFIDRVKIQKGDLEYIQLIEPIWYVPIKYVTDNPLSKWFYHPEYYTVMGQIIHSSRLMKFIYGEAPNILKPQYNFNGIPLLQQALKYVMNFATVTNTIVEIIQRLNLTVLKTGLSTIAASTMSDGSKKPIANIGNRIRGLNAGKRNNSTIVIDKDNEDIINLTMSLTGLDGLLSQFAEQMCIVGRMPVVRFLGISPKGLNSTGEFEMKQWNSEIKSRQEKMFRPNLIQIMQMAMLNLWGEIDEDITFDFVTLDEANELEESTIRFNDAQSANLYVQMQSVTPQQVAEKIADDPDSGFNNIEIDEAAWANQQSEYYPEGGTLEQEESEPQTPGTVAY